LVCENCHALKVGRGARSRRSSAEKCCVRDMVNACGVATLSLLKLGSVSNYPSIAVINLPAKWKTCKIYNLPEKKVDPQRWSKRRVERWRMSQKQHLEVVCCSLSLSAQTITRPAYEELPRPSTPTVGSTGTPATSTIQGWCRKPKILDPKLGKRKGEP
jgi:hypothetical protein